MPFGPSRSVSLLISGPKWPAKTDKNGVKQTSTIVPVSKLQFFTVQAWVITTQFYCLAYTDTNKIHTALSDPRATLIPRTL